MKDLKAINSDFIQLKNAASDYSTIKNANLEAMLCKEYSKYEMPSSSYINCLQYQLNLYDNEDGNDEFSKEMSAALCMFIQKEKPTSRCAKILGDRTYEWIDF